MSKPILLKNLGKHITPAMEEKHWDSFEKRAGYLGNGIYKIENLHSTDTRELFLMFCAQQEGINFDKE
jgi:hypothetical protein